jgi:hypothetical protein
MQVLLSKDKEYYTYVNLWHKMYAASYFGKTTKIFIYRILVGA